MEIDPKNAQLIGVYHNNFNTSNHPKNQGALKHESKATKTGANPSLQTEGSILTTMNSVQTLNIKDSLDISNITIFLPSNNKNNISLKTNKKYSYNKDYFDELYQNLLLDEHKFYQRINSNYMSFQKYINYKMRAILVDWLIDVHFQFDMKKKTLFQCVFIIDAYLSKVIIERKNFQLLGLAALFIACKENEITYPPLKSFIALSENLYTLEELINMEIKVIKKLDFDILSPTAEEFFGINADNFEFTEKQRFFGEYILDASLIDYNLLKYKQSTIAVACGYIVIKFFNLNGVNQIINNTYSDIKPKEVKDCARDLCYLVKNLSKSSLVATKNKYISNKYMNVAQLCEDN